MCQTQKDDVTAMCPTELETQSDFFSHVRSQNKELSVSK